MTTAALVHETTDPAHIESGRPVIFLHGWTMGGHLFDGQLQRLSPQFHCLAPDLPGHGSAAALPASIDSAADYLHQIITDRCLDNVALVGWSMGAATAWRYIAKYGTGALGHLITVDMSPKIGNEKGWRLGLKGQSVENITANSARFQADWPASAGAIAAGMFANRQGGAGFDFDAALAQISSTDPVAMNAIWASLVAMDERATIAKIDIPYLACFGSLSRVYPSATADWLVRKAPQCTKHGFAKSGHSPHLEEPDAFARTLTDFLTRP